MTLDHFTQIHAPSIMAVRGSRANTPQRHCQKLLLQRPVEVPLPEVRAEVVTLEVGEDVPDEEGLQRWPLQVREGAGIVGFDEQRRCRREQVVENPPLDVKDRLNVRHTPVSVDLQIGNVAVRTPDLHKDRPAGVD